VYDYSACSHQSGQDALRSTHSYLHNTDVQRSCLTRDRARRRYSRKCTEKFASLIGNHGTQCRHKWRETKLDGTLSLLSVLEVATVGCSFDLKAIATPGRQKDGPVTVRRVRSSVACDIGDGLVYAPHSSSSLSLGAPVISPGPLHIGPSKSVHSQEKYLYVRRSRTWWVDEGEEARRLYDSRRYGGETDRVYDQNKVCTESSPDHCEWPCIGVG
jgi:hypothetical protein